MSKIYDALSRGHDEVGEVVRKIVGDNHVGEHTGESANGNGASSPVSNDTSLDKLKPSAVVAPEPIRVEALSPEAPILVLNIAQARAAEQFRIMRTKISQHPRKPRIIAFSSGNPGDSKTFNAINLAATI